MSKVKKPCISLRIFPISRLFFFFLNLFFIYMINEPCIVVSPILFVQCAFNWDLKSARERIFYMSRRKFNTKVAWFAQFAVQRDMHVLENVSASLVNYALNCKLQYNYNLNLRVIIYYVIVDGQRYPCEKEVTFSADQFFSSWVNNWILKRR